MPRDADRHGERAGHVVHGVEPDARSRAARALAGVSSSS